MPPRITAAIKRELHQGEAAIWQQPRAKALDFTAAETFLRGLVPLGMGVLLTAWVILIPFYPDENETPVALALFLLLFAVIVLPLGVFYTRQPFDPLLRPGAIWYVATHQRIMTFSLSKERKVGEVLVADVGIMERREQPGGAGHVMFVVAPGEEPLAKPYTIGPIENPAEAFKAISALRIAERRAQRREAGTGELSS
jgi:hypothetical protein